MDPPADPPVVIVPQIPVTHPDTLVALATARIKFTELPQTTRTNVAVALITGDDSRFVNFLDALASLSVSHLKGQVVAIGLQIDEGMMVLTVAENGEVLPALIDHLVELLLMLRAMSPGEEKLYREIRHRHFYLASYTHACTKINKRFAERPWLQKVDAALQSYNSGPMLHGLKIVISSLLTLHEMIVQIKKVKDANSKEPRIKLRKIMSDVIPKDEWRKVIKMMTASASLAQTMLNGRKMLDWWAEELIAHVSLTGPDGLPIPVPLYRAIEKLTSHHRHIIHLFSYATSRWGGQDLRNFLVVPKPKEVVNPQIEYPSRENMGRIIHRYLAANPGVAFDPNLDLITFEAELNRIKDGIQIGSNIVLNDSGPVFYEGIVHCECALITSYNPDPAPQPRWPIAYIGVSKLSCAACYAWIQAFNNTHAAQYQTRGTHGRWYPKWAMPSGAMVQTPEMKDELSRIVGLAYRTHYDAGTNVAEIIFSDSSEAKGTFLERQMDMIELSELGRECEEMTRDRLKTV